MSVTDSLWETRKHKFEKLHPGRWLGDAIRANPKYKDVFGTAPHKLNPHDYSLDELVSRCISAYSDNGVDVGLHKSRSGAPMNRDLLLSEGKGTLEECEYLYNRPPPDYRGILRAKITDLDVIAGELVSLTNDPVAGLASHRLRGVSSALVRIWESDDIKWSS